jgi:hypothetical protein
MSINGTAGCPPSGGKLDCACAVVAHGAAPMATVAKETAMQDLKRIARFFAEKFIEIRQKMKQ